MKHKAWMGTAITVAVFLFPASAIADSIQGTITRTTASGIDLTVYDQNGMPYPNGLHLKTDRRTQVNGVPSAAMLRRNDFVKADVRQENDGTWRADSLTRLGVAAAKPQGQSFASSVQSAGTKLMDTLRSPTGQKYLKSGLTGAVVGGTSAYAAGGKGGKGALVGAGLGAAATLIQDIFNQPRPQTTQAPVYTDDRGIQQ